MNFEQYFPESNRLQFIYERDNLEEAYNFARKTLPIYRNHVLKRKYDVLNKRRTFIESYLAFKKFIKDYKEFKRYNKNE